MSTTIHDVKTWIRGASKNELSELITHFNARTKELDAQAMYKWRVGDKVKFDAGRRGMVYGTITGFARNRVQVNSTYGTPWKVSAGLLQASTHA